MANKIQTQASKAASPHTLQQRVGNQASRDINPSGIKLRVSTKKRSYLSTKTYVDQVRIQRGGGGGQGVRTPPPGKVIWVCIGNYRK